MILLRGAVEPLIRNDQLTGIRISTSQDPSCLQRVTWDIQKHRHVQFSKFAEILKVMALPVQ